MFFIDLYLHLSEFNLKLQGNGKSLGFMLRLVKSFEVKLNVFIHDIENYTFKCFKHLNTFFIQFKCN